MKSYLLEIFKRDLSDAAIDFRQEWEKAFSEVNSERAQYQAAVNLSARIQSLAEQVEERLVLRGKIIVWRPLIEAGLQQWQSHFDSKTQELAARLQQHQEVLKQLVSRIKELSAEQFDAEITVTRGAETVGGQSIMGILTLGAGIGSTILVSATGPQAAEAIEAIAALVANRFGEDE